MLWLFLSIAGLAVETTLIVVLGCQVTERYEAGRSSVAPNEVPLVSD